MLEERDLFYGKLTKCVMVHTQEVLYNVSKDLYYCHPSSGKGKIDLTEFYEKLGYEIDHFPQTFCFNYETDETNEDLDITMLCKLINLLEKGNKCFENKIDSKKGLLENVNEIRKIRNKVFRFILDKSTSESLKNDLVQYISKICNCMITIFEGITYENQTEIHEKYQSLQENIVCSITQTWECSTENDSDLMKILKNKAKDPLKQFVTECRKELMKLYENLYSMPSFLLQDDLNFSVEEMFVPVSLLVNDKNVHYQDILQYSHKKKERAPPVVVISGDAGHGKTTLCKKLTLEWCESCNKKKIVSLQDYDLVLLIEVKKAKETGLSQYLKEILLRDSLSNIKEKEIYYFLKELDVLIIIDAYDEKSREAGKLIRSLLDVLSDKKFIITTRPYYSREIFSSLNNYKLDYLNLQIQGFEERVVKKFVDKIWNPLKKKYKCGDSKKFKAYLDVLPVDFHAVFKVPLMTVLLIYLWINSETNDEHLQSLTFTNLYRKVFDLQKKCIVNKIKQDIKEGKSYEQFEKVTSDLIQALAECCYRNKVNGGNVINDDLISTLQEEFDKKGLKKEHLEIFLSTLFLYTPCVRNHSRSSDVLFGQYEFLHKTQMEYLVANHIVLLITQKSSNLKLENVPLFNRHYLMQNSEVFSFTVGLLNANGSLENYIEVVYSILKQDWSIDYNLLWKIVSETRSEKKLDFCNLLEPNYALCKYIQKSLPLEWKLNEGNVVSGLNLLRYIDVRLEYMEIHFSRTYDPCNMQMFSLIFSKVKEILVDRQEKKQRRKINIDLHFVKHEQEGKGSSDHFLMCLESWANLQKFTGHLEEGGIKFIDSCYNLSKIKVHISSLEALKLLNDALKMKKKLTLIYISFDKPFSKFDFPKLHVMKADISIDFHSVRNREEAMHMLKILKPENGSFFSIIMKLDEEISLEEGKAMLCKLKKLVCEKFVIQSPYDMEESDYEQLKCSLGLGLKWNHHGY